MKIQSIFRSTLLFFAFAAASFFAENLNAQREPTERTSFHFDDDDHDHDVKNVASARPEKPALTTTRKNPTTPGAVGNAYETEINEFPPVVNIFLAPSDATNLFYHPVAAYTSAQQPKSQISIGTWVQNLEPKNIYLTRIEYKYQVSGVTKTQTYNCGPDTIPPGMTGFNDNGRGYHEKGDVIYIDGLASGQIEISIFFKNHIQPAKITRTLKAYDKYMGMPFKTGDLKLGEVWESGSTHGSGNWQVFGYDMAVYGKNNSGVWSPWLPGKDDSKNEHHRIWGKKVVAMADGVVLEIVNNCPDNPKPGTKANYDAITNGFAGNHVFIKHGNLVTMYAHFIKGSVSSTLTVGGTVKKGDFLGLAGNSGNSSGPHLHISARSGPGVEQGPHLPIIFDQGYVIEKTALTSVGATNAPWVQLDGKGIPGYEGKRSFIWPSNMKPVNTDDRYTGVFRAETADQTIVPHLSKSQFTAQDNTLKSKGLRLTDIAFYEREALAGLESQHFSGVWRPGTQETFVQMGVPTWAAFIAEWQTKSNQGFRLMDLEIYTEEDEIRIAGLYTKPATAHGHYLYIGMTKAQLQTKTAELAAQNFRLVNVQMYEENEEVKYAAIWHPGTDQQQLVFGTDFTNFYNQFKNQSLRLVEYDYLQIGSGLAAQKYSVGVFRTGTGDCQLIDLPVDDFGQVVDDMEAKGLRVVDLHVQSNNIVTQ